MRLATEKLKVSRFLAFFFDFTSFGTRRERNIKKKKDHDLFKSTSFNQDDKYAINVYYREIYFYFLRGKRIQQKEIEDPRLFCCDSVR